MFNFLKKLVAPREVRYFTCSMCHRRFEMAEGSDIEAQQEVTEIFGKVPEGELRRVCETCYNKCHPDKFPILTRAARKMIERKNQVGSKKSCFEKIFLTLFLLFIGFCVGWTSAFYVVWKDQKKQIEYIKQGNQ